MKLYVKFAEEKLPETLREFLEKYYSVKQNFGYNKGHDTFFDKECEDLHCNKSFRSFDDLLDLSQTYYPETTPKDLFHILLTLNVKLKNGNKSKPHLATCGTMGRIRYIPYVLDISQLNYTLNTKMKNSKYTWNDLFKMLDLKPTLEAIEKYIKENSK